jgi:hypothetical protein
VRNRLALAFRDRFARRWETWGLTNTERGEMDRLRRSTDVQGLVRSCAAVPVSKDVQSIFEINSLL